LLTGEVTDPYLDGSVQGRRVAREAALSKWSQPIGGQAFGRAWRLLDCETGQHERTLVRANRSATVV
ncbi:hypothetical protein M404DRAFT_1006722, partial [Pisolithus tinctorius Marx 270]